MIVHSAFTAHMTLLSSCCFIGEIRHQQEAPTPNTCAPVEMQQYNITARCPMLRIKMQYQGNSIIKSELCMWSPWKLRYIIKIASIILIFMIAIKLAPIMCGLWMVTDQYSVVGLLFQNCNTAINANSWISREKNEKNIPINVWSLPLSGWSVVALWNARPTGRVIMIHLTTQHCNVHLTSHCNVHLTTHPL